MKVLSEMAAVGFSAIKFSYSAFISASVKTRYQRRV